MAASRPRVLLRTVRALAVTAAATLTACESDPGTVLQTDLPQIPGMTGRESSGLRQTGGVVEAGTFAYKGAIPDLGKQVDETKSRFSGLGWTLASERRTSATARLEFTKGNRKATVELIRNDLSPGMSTGVTVVKSSDAPASAAPPATSGNG